MFGFEKKQETQKPSTTVSGVVSRIGVGVSYDSTGAVSVFILLVGESDIREFYIDCHPCKHDGRPPFMAEWSLTQSGDMVTLVAQGGLLTDFKNETLTALRGV